MIRIFVLWALLSISSLVHAEGGYELINPAQPVQNPDKIEVIEFFWYGCPHCYSLEPALQAWLKKKPANVEFIHQPAVFSDVWGKHAKAYYTADHGVKDDDFRAAYGSFIVDTKFRQAEAMAGRYGISGVPALIVNGKYKITASTAKSQENMLLVLDELIKQESKAK